MITIVISCLITVDYYYAHVNAIHYPITIDHWLINGNWNTLMLLNC
jgi:hypothetical protein